MGGKYFGGPEAQNQAHFCWRWKNLPSYLVLCFVGVRYWTWAVSFCQNKSQTSRLSVSEISVWPFNHQFISLVPPACRITVEFACYRDFYALHYPRKGNHCWKMFPLKEFSNLGQHDRWKKHITFVFHFVQSEQKIWPFEGIANLYIVPGLHGIPWLGYFTSSF